MDRTFLNLYPKNSRYETFLLLYDDFTCEYSVLALSYHLERIFLDNINLKKEFRDVLSLKEYFIEQIRARKVFDRATLVRLISSESKTDILSTSFNAKVIDFAKCVFYKGVRENPLLKTTPSDLSVLARGFAEEMGFSEAILVDNNDIIREGAWTSFFWFDQSGILYTADTFVLPGVLRRLVMEFTSFNKTNLKLVDIPKSKLINEMREGFICNSVLGIVPVRQIEEIDYDIKLYCDPFIKSFRNYLNNKYEFFKL